MGQLAVFVFLLLTEVLVPGLQTARADILESYRAVGTMDVILDESGIIGTLDGEVVFRTEHSRTHASVHLVQVDADTPFLVDLSDLLRRYRSFQLIDTVQIDFETGDQLPFPDLQGPLRIHAADERLYVALPEHELLFVVKID